MEHTSLVKNRNKENVQYYKTHDELTGLYNRTYFESRSRLIDMLGRYPYSMVIADINGLKIINEVFGFHIGDLMLRRIGDSLTYVAGTNGIAARWGGDEYAIILPETDEIEVEKKCRKILTECSKIKENQMSPSIALGFATKHDSAESLSNILLKAEERMYRSKLLEGQSTHSSIITSLRKALFQRSSETEEHAQRMQEVSMKVGKVIGLSRDEMEELYLLAELHDIGKIAIADKILSKPSMLTANEWKEMKKHSEIGYNIASASNDLSVIAECILSHHERWDGLGYPQGLKGREIPKLSRIVAIADTYDAITNERPYKKALSHEKAIIEIERCSGTQFDPEIVKAFYKIFLTKVA